MKKLLTAMLCAALLLCCAALAESPVTVLGTVDMNGTFELQCQLPEGYQLIDARDSEAESYLAADASPTSFVAVIASEDDTRPVMVLSIAFDELYADVFRLNDLSEEEQTRLADSFRGEDEVEITRAQTRYGTDLLVVKEVRDTVDFVDFFTVYMGYDVEFVLLKGAALSADESLTDEQIQMAIDFLSELFFVDLDPETYAQAPAEAVALYCSDWYSEDAWAEICQEDGALKVQVRKTNAYPDALCWEYATDFNAETKALEARGGDGGNGVLFRIRYSEDGGFDYLDTVYEDGVGSFSLDDSGRLIWQDAKEDAGKGIAFRKIGSFNGTSWVCGRASIDIAWEDEGYKVYIQWGNSASESSEWTYSCLYDPETNTMTDAGFGCREEVTYGEDGLMVSAREVYSDGEATFSLDENGRLIWQDAKEDAGKGMAFELLDPNQPAE